MLYRTKEGEVLDLICLRHYGRSDQRIVEQVLEANFQLAEQGAVYPDGIEIELPELALSDEKREEKRVELWD